LGVRKVAGRDIEGLDLSSWRVAANGAEPVNPSTLQRFAERFARYGFRPEAIAPVYGLAEASLCVSCPRLGSGAKVDRIQRNLFEEEGRAIPTVPGDANAIEFVSAGVPLPGTDVRLVNGEGVDVEERTEGHLWFRSPSATSGYYHNPEATREILRGNGWIDSGDLAYRADGELYITGRVKDIIIKGGRNIYPHEVEEIAGRVPGVRTGCVVAFGIPDPKTGTERLVVAAEVRDPAQRNRVAGELTQRISGSLGMPPDTVELLPPHAIPKTSSGKLRRSETKRLYIEGRLGKRVLPAWLQVAKLALPGAGPWLGAAARKGIRRAGETVYGVYALCVFAALFLPLWLVVLLAPNRRFAAQVTHAGLRIILAAAGVRVSVEGREILEQAEKAGPWIFAPNHASYLDIVALMAYLPADARFVAKGEVRSMPFMGTFAKRGGHFTFDRNNPQARIDQAKQVNDALRHSVSVVVYPEGTFTPLPGIRPFLLGAFKAAVDTGRPICPVAVRGAREILRDGTYLPKPGRITLTFGPLLTPQSGGDWRELVHLRDATREILARNSGEPML
jgi:1-acyl-sn-glycerol-3-phosphate acyltransferase